MTALSTAPALVPGGELVLHAPETDPTVRWRPGDRLHHLFERRRDAHPDRLAVGRGDLAVTYADLDDRANRLARYLHGRGVRQGDRVGLVLDEPLRAYVAILAVLKLHAAYVPLDAGFPADRVAYICDDAGVGTLLTLSHLGERLADVSALCDVVCLDEVDAQVAAQPARRPDVGPPVDDLCYVIYTSGTTGRPKGVAIEHAAIVNFVRVAAEVYGVRPDDRMYQGMTIAFDFSVEEIWVAFAVGATLVPRPGAALLGDDLAAFLREERVTALCCVPTLLATMDDDLPDLRFLLVSGEACPQDLVARWHRSDRRFLNVYGPTEATVTATWTVLHPGSPVTIGVPLPTYSVVILDEQTRRPLPPGEIGEIGLRGIGLARGYLGRDDLTEKAFLPHVPGLPPGRVYRTGDLGRVTEDGLVECLGRIDTQVKVRGYRIELTEIESVLLAEPGIAQAVVDTYEPTPGAVELVAYVTARRAGESVDAEALHTALSARLPRYMVPAYLEQLDRIPMLPSDKADRKALPPPTRRMAAGAGEYVAPEGAVEEAVAAGVAAVLGVERVSATAQLFDDLGMNSLLMARLCTVLRDRPEVMTPTMKDVYLHPTVRELAAVLPAVTAPKADSGPRPVHRASALAYAGSGAVQALAYVVLAHLVAGIGLLGYRFLTAGSGLVEVYLRAVAVGAATFVVLSLLPVAAKWLLIGRWRPATIPVWSPAYLRFWAVRQLLRASPARVFVGSPLYSAYLRLLGAQVGPGALVFVPPPTCADLVTIGAGAVIRKDAVVNGYRAESGWIRTGPVHIGAGADIGENSLVDIDTALGDGARLAHASSLQPGQRVPAGRKWHGSPAVDAGPARAGVAPVELGRSRRAAYGTYRLAALLLGWGPLATGLLFVALPTVLPGVAASLGGSAVGYDFTSGAFWLRQFLLAGVVLLTAILAGLLTATAVPRMLRRLVPADVVHPLYGLRYAAQRAIVRTSNLPFLHALFGDSSFIVGYLRAIGYDLSSVQQTGSNFGLTEKHDTPFHTRVGPGTLVSDGLSVVNTDWSSTSFTVRHASLGAASFVGNSVVYPAGARIGDDCLLATKVMVPTDGPVRSGVGLLGSPPFEIPRTVRRDVEAASIRTSADFAARLAAKTRSNLVTMALFLLSLWLQLAGVLVIGAVAAEGYPVLGLPSLALGLVATLVFTTLSSVFVERAVRGFRRLRPHNCSIYDPYFWGHERLWKVSGNGAYLRVFDGTPLKSGVWRLLGVRVGRRLFDDGAGITEKTLVTIGDHCTLGARSTIQGHSLEDGGFKSDHIVLGDGVTIGANSFVHYGAVMRDRSVLDADAFLMKGETVAPDSRWAGNPAHEIDEPVSAVPPRRPWPFEAALPVVAVAAGVGHAAMLGARGLPLVACAALLVAVALLARGLGVRPGVVAALLAGLAAVPAAVTVLSAAGPGPAGAAWLTAGAALLARDRQVGRFALGVAAVVTGIVVAPVLAVPVVVTGAVLAVAVRWRWNAVVVAAAPIAALAPLALAPPPGGAAAVPTLLVAVVLAAGVLLDETLRTRR